MWAGSTGARGTRRAARGTAPPPRPAPRVPSRRYRGGSIGPKSSGSASSGRASRSGATPACSASVAASALCTSKRRRRLGERPAHGRGVGRRDAARPEPDEPPRLELEHREVWALLRVLPEDAETGNVRMQRAVDEGELGAEDAAEVGVEVRNVEVVAGRADDHVEGAVAPVGEDDPAALDRRDRGPARDAAVGDLPEVVLAERDPRHEDVRVRCRCAELLRRPGHADDAVAEPRPELVAREEAPLERAEEREPLPVGDDPVRDLLDHVALLAEGRHDRGDRREVRGDLEAADAAPVDERGAVAERPGARVVERVQELAGEPVEAVRGRVGARSGRTRRRRRRTARRRRSSLP